MMEINTKHSCSDRECTKTPTCYWCDVPTDKMVVASFVSENETVPMCIPCQVENGYRKRVWFQHLCFAGELMRKGQFREEYPIPGEPEPRLIDDSDIGFCAA